MAKYLSRRAKKLPQTGITSDRYQFLGLEQAEPDLGDPIVGPSSVSAKKIPLVGNQYVLVAIDNEVGSRYWVPSTNIQNSGLIPGSFTIFNNGFQVGLANSFNIFNFVGTGVTVDPVGFTGPEQTGIATVRIQVLDLSAPGNPYEIPYNDPVSGFLKGATGVVYRNNNVGIGSTLPTKKLDVLGDVNVSNTLFTKNIYSTGISTFTNVKVGSGNTIVTITETGRIGINSASPQTLLDVNGNVKLNGSISLINGTGTPGQVLLSNGSSPASWKNVSEVTVGAATSLAITNINNDLTYYLTFANPVDAVTSVYADLTNLVYNPGTNRLGIGTTIPQHSFDVANNAQVSGTLYVKDVVTKSSTAEEITKSNSGILTTTSTNSLVVDSFDANTFRSAKYTVQLTSTGNLGIGTTISVKNLNKGKNYFPGTYTNVPLTTITGNGSGALATINVLPEFTLGITSCSGGIFTFTGSSVGIETGQTLYFNEKLSILPLEQSKLTQVQLTSSGFGYTSIPGITVESPIITNNPVSGVGVGSTAVLTVNSMIVKDFNTNVGISTTAYPTVLISSPTVGTVATGLVGVGISEFTITNSGVGYTVSPNISVSKVTAFSGRVGLGISNLDWQTSGGSGYTFPPVITVTGQNGIGTGAVIEADINADAPNNLINFTITNPGFGYTVPPTVTITSGGGSNASVTISKMIVRDVTVLNPGYGATSQILPSDIVFTSIGGTGIGATASVFKIIPTNVLITNPGSGYTTANIPVTATFSNPSIAATVSLGVESVSVTSTGIGYTVLPTLTFDSPTLGIGSTAILTATKLGYNQDNLYPGPGLGQTVAAYYIKPLTANTFGITTSINGPLNTLGYQINTGTTIASIGGTVNSINITFGGSGYAVNNVIGAVNLDAPRIDTNVGTGFSFSVNSEFDNFQISELLVLHNVNSGNSNAAYVVENGGIADALELGDFSADVSSNNARLIFNPVFANNTIKYHKTMFTV